MKSKFRCEWRLLKDLIADFITEKVHFRIRRAFAMIISCLISRLIKVDDAQGSILYIVRLRLHFLLFSLNQNVYALLNERQ